MRTPFIDCTDMRIMMLPGLLGGFIVLHSALSPSLLSTSTSEAGGVEVQTMPYENRQRPSSVLHLQCKSRVLRR